MTRTASNVLSLPEVAAGFARLHDYLGLWSIEAQRFQVIWQSVRAMDIGEHMRLNAKHAPTPQRGCSQMVIVEGRSRGRGGDSVAIIRADGVLMKHLGSLDEGTSTVHLRRQVREAANDPSIGGILLVLDSPGGTVAGTADLAADLRAAAEQKPLHAFIEDLGASAAYWLASQAARITANDRTAFVGSIGTLIGLYDLSRNAEQEGIEAVVLGTGPLKGAGFPGAPITAEHRDYFRGIVESTQESFRAAVVAGRGLDLEQVLELETGGVWLADEAQDLGLIDGIESIDAAVAALQDVMSQDNDSTARSRSGSRASIQAPKRESEMDPNAKSKQQPAATADPTSDNPTAPLAQPAAAGVPGSEASEGKAPAPGAQADGKAQGEQVVAEPQEPAEPAAKQEGEQAEPAAAAPATPAEKPDGKAFIEAFGQQGAVWYVEGKTFAEAQALHVAALKAENEQLKARLSTVDRGAAEPIPLTPEGTGDGGRQSSLAPKIGANLARYAAGIELPGQKS